MLEVRDPNSQAILFKRTDREKRMDSLEEKVNILLASIGITPVDHREKEKEN